MGPKLPKRRLGRGAGSLGLAESVPRPISALADNFAPGVVIPVHRHERAQLTYAIRGTITVRAGDGLWILPPSHALWIPEGVDHEIRMNGAVEMCTLYVAPTHAKAVAANCRVLAVSSLLRELIARAMELPVLYDEQGTHGRVMQLLLDEIAALPAKPLGVPMPRDPRLTRVCELALRDLSGRTSVRGLCKAVGLSERNLARLFARETGLRFGQWLTQARLLKAFELFDLG